MKMKGWAFYKTNEPLKLIEKDIPKVKPGYALVEVKACGLCHTDVTILSDPGWISILGELPVILGHEVAGEIIELGEGIKGFKVGDRVAISPMPGSDGIGGVGTGRDGGYATHVLVQGEMLIHVPDEVDIAQAAAATDAGMTSHQAVIGRGGVKEGTKVGIIGIGGLGKVGTNIAVGAGAKVYCASRKEEARQKALDLGAYKVAESILDFKDENLEVIIDFAGSGQTTIDALETIGMHGTVVVVGMAKLESNISTKTLILKQANVIGSNGGTKKDIESVIEMMRQGKLSIDVETTTLEKVPEGLDYLHEGKVNGRLIMLNE